MFWREYASIKGCKGLSFDPDGLLKTETASNSGLLLFKVIYIANVFKSFSWAMQVQREVI